MALVRSWPITFVTALLTAAVLVGAGLALTGGSGDNSTRAAAGPTPAQEAAAAASAAAAISPSASVGPEGVPLLKGAALGPAHAPRPGRSSGGIPCGSKETLTYHVH